MRDCVLLLKAAMSLDPFVLIDMVRGISYWVPQANRIYIYIHIWPCSCTCFLLSCFRFRRHNMLHWNSYICIARIAYSEVGTISVWT